MFFLRDGFCVVTSTVTYLCDVRLMFAGTAACRCDVQSRIEDEKILRKIFSSSIVPLIRIFI